MDGPTLEALRELQQQALDALTPYEGECSELGDAYRAVEASLALIMTEQGHRPSRA